MSQALSKHTLTPEARAALAAGDLGALFALQRARYGGFTMELGDPAGGDPVNPDPADAGNEDPDKGEQDPAEDGKDPRVTRANREAAQYRTQLRATETKVGELESRLAESDKVLAALKAAFGGEAAEADPAEQVTQLTTQTETLTSENAQLKAALLVHDLAGAAGANAVALLDSRSFTDTLAGLDSAASDYRDQVAAAIKDAVTKNAAYRAGQGSSRGGSELNPGEREKANQRATSLQEAISRRLNTSK